MRQLLLQDLSVLPLPITPEPNAPAISGGGGSGLFWFLLDCHGLLFNLALIAPSAIFVGYLASIARNSFAKLTYGRSYIMIAYYVPLWVVSVLNLVWCFLQSMQCNPAKQSSWNMLSLFTNSGMLFLEISLVAFLLQGNHATGSDALTRTFIVSGIIVAGDMLLKAVYVFGFGVPLFIDDHETNRVKWGLWIVHKLLLTAVYCFILFLHHSKWRERLPASSKACLLQLRLCNVRIKFGITFCMRVCRKWICTWVLVIGSCNGVLSLALSSFPICDISSRFFPGGRHASRKCLLL